MNQRGTLTVEFALLVPSLLLLFGAVIGGGRVWLARDAVEHVAGAAARAASLERTPAQAISAAHRLGEAQARADGLRCQPLGLGVSADAFTRPVGAPGEIRVTARCQVPLADVLVPGWLGVITVEATATSVLDSYRGRK